MRNYRALIVDDELDARKLIQSFLSDFQHFDIVGSAASGIEALELAKEHKPDLLLLDIQMPEMNGFQVIEKLTPPLPVVVFVTAFDEYAIQAFEVNALDYLLKPVDRGRFKESMVRVAENLKMGVDDPEIFSKLLASLNEQQNQKYKTNLISKEKGRSHLIPVEDITHIEAMDNYVKIYREEEFKVGSYKLGDLEHSLDPSIFTRVHRSVIVNRKKIIAVEPYFHGEYFLFVGENVKVKLSRSYKHKLDQILNG